MNGTFYEQLGSVAGLFEQWGACERTVVAVALARRVPWPGLRLLQRAVDAALRPHRDDERLERDANDEALLAALLAPPPRPDDDEDDEVERLRRLLTLLPLLRTDNERAKEAYVAAAPALVRRCVERRPPSAAPDLCRQLLAYLLVHPATSPGDHRTLTQWLRYLENHISGNMNTETVWQQRIEPGLLPDNIWGSGNSFRRTIGKNVEFRGIDPLDASFTTDLLQESFSKNGRDVEISLEGEKLNFDAAIAQPKQRSNSLTPPSSNFMQMSSSAENLSDEAFVQKPRSFSLSSEHSLPALRPLAGLYGTTGSETRLDSLRGGGGARPGMSTVAHWLKGLRLHKYVWLFTNISYDQMMAIDEKYLEKLGVTKGARHKILVSIKKLAEREAAVAAVEAELAGAGAGGGAAAARALERLRHLLLSPMPPESPLPAAIVRALELASKTICQPAGCQVGSASGTVATGGSGGASGTATLAVAEEELGCVDPLSLHCWLVERALHHESFSRPELQTALRALRHRLPPRQFFHHVCDLPAARHHLKPRWRTGPPNGYQKAGKRWAASGATHAVPPGVPRGKSHSYPPYPGAPPPRPPPRPPLDYSSLDALCLQMTEQAIN